MKLEGKKKRIIAILLMLVMIFSLAGCSGDDETQKSEGAKKETDGKETGKKEESTDLVAELGLTADSKEATKTTIEVNSAFYSMLDFEDTTEAEFARKGLIDAPEVLELKDENGKVIWSQAAYSFLNDYEKAPDTVNPSLWENSKNNHYYGLFQVTENIYQVRGYDMSNLTLIKGDTGWIIFDPLMSMECTKAAMDLVEKNLGKLPVKAVVMSHPHVDHYGGIKGVMSAEEAADVKLSIEEQATSGKIPIIVPEGFTQHAVSENVYAGTAMGRRAAYQYGTYLSDSVKGSMAMGIGMGQSVGTITFITPTYEIRETGETITIDGVTMEFQMTPGTEAPAEMNTWFPQFKALWVAENCTGTLHNLYTLRGAQVRDGAAWSKYICEAITRYGDEVEVTFQSHNWPHWGNEVVNQYMEDTAAIYKFINDQTLTYINQGYTSDEISNMIKLPKGLEENWCTRQYYGTVAHDSKAVYQKYMGWYDANPVNLNPLTPVESATKWQEYMGLGSVDEVLRQAKKDFDKGEYQWVAEVTNTIVYANPENKAARLLCADALEQLGYQSESGTWRNAYLSGALELRGGNTDNNDNRAVSSGDLTKEMTTDMLLDYMGIVLDKEAMSKEENFSINITVTDTDEKFLVKIADGVILKFANDSDEDAKLSITATKAALFLLMGGDEEAFKNAVQLEGDTAYVTKLMTNLNQVKMGENASFNIVEP